MHSDSETTKNPLNDILRFLQTESRLDLKHISLDHLLGLTGTDEGIKTLLKNEKIIQCLIELTNDKVEDIAKIAFFILINVTARPVGAKEILIYRSVTQRNILELLIQYILDPQNKEADAACMILSNLTRLEDESEIYLNAFIPHLNDILNAFTNMDFNKNGSKLHYISPVFGNLSRCNRIRKWLTEENPYVPLIKILPFCNYEDSIIRRGGAVSIIRNLSFDSNYHDFLLSPDLDLLTYLLSPLMGNEDYPDEEMDVLPISLQYLPKEKHRDPDTDIRTMILDTLNKLCMKRKGREVLRNNGVYYVLREYHKWEKDPKALLTCENVVDILIQKEEEVGAEDLSTVEVPKEMVVKFDKMDADYLKNV